jgi:hypothetical protein
MTHRLDVQAALQTLRPTDTTPPVVQVPTPTIVSGSTLGTSMNVKLSWSATDPSGVVAYELWASTNGATSVKQTLPSATTTTITYALNIGTSYRFFVRAKDAYGNWSADVNGYGPTFTPNAVDDRSTAISYNRASGSTTSSWSYAAWSPAYKGTITTATKAGEYARYVFTGRSVALVASLGTNRGQAKIFLDGTLVKTVDLYAATATAARIAYATSWATSGRHTIDVQVVGTAGRPTIDVDAFATLS